MATCGSSPRCGDDSSASRLLFASSWATSRNTRAVARWTASYALRRTCLRVRSPVTEIARDRAEQVDLPEVLLELLDGGVVLF